MIGLFKATVGTRQVVASLALYVSMSEAHA